MKKYWLHRISWEGHATYNLLMTDSLLTTGWEALSAKDFLKYCTSSGKFEACFSSAYAMSAFKPRNRYFLKQFIFDMRKCDIVLVPVGGAFHICEIMDDNAISVKEFDGPINAVTSDNQKIIKKDGHLCAMGSEKILDIGFLRPVKIIARNVPRYNYAEGALTSRLKARGTTYNISDLEGDIKRTQSAFEEKAPINLKNVFLEFARINLIEAIRKRLSPDKFQKLIKLYFEKIGADNVVIPAKNEAGKHGDTDIIASFNAMNLTIYVQAKFHINQSSNKAAQQIDDYVKDKMEKDDDLNTSKIAWIITSADSWSKDAIQYCEENGIIYIDGKGFAEMLLNSGLSNLDNI